ncbi:telomerase Cajal body protein 1 homolog [Harmonia axyridis]|uniref:telomerase Cajal body protein 1 homolog n=1 Tax=Harmonia axyridis TaxID=115357 RepID=UPI001E2761AB|nr:telomerase Cajal body protein 1 homolog [Harmonia axyridis]
MADGDYTAGIVYEMPTQNYVSYNFEKSALELGRIVWPNYDDQHYLKGCYWSPDGTCLLTVVRGAGMHICELPNDLYSADVLMTSRQVNPLTPAVSVPEQGLIYDVCWYPGMNSSMPATCCWLSSGHEGPVHLWDAFTGTLRCSYRGYNAVDEIDPALSVCFSADGQSIFCGSKKSVKTFATSRPGREYYAYEVSHPASCIVASEAQPGVVAIGSWKNTIELVSQSDGTFRHLCKLQGHKGGITSMAFSLDGYKLFSGARKDKEIICWDLRVPGRPLFCLGREVNTNQKIAIDLSRCGRYLVSGGTDGKVLAWDISLNCAPQENYQMPLHSDCCNGVSLHPTKPILATSSGQHHTMDPLHHTRSSFSYENSLCMWWLGNQQEDPDLITAIIRAATNS